MFILKRSDVEISSIQHPQKDQKIPILSYQGQTFRLLSVFNANQEEEARSFWRELTDNQGKACVLLEEPDRYSVWGKVRLEALASEMPAASEGDAIPILVQGGLLMLQTIYIDVEDLLGAKQAHAFEKDLSEVFSKGRFPQTESPNAIKELLALDPLNSLQVPAWKEQHLTALLQELHRLGKAYFGKSPFIARALDTLQDMREGDRKHFLEWLGRSPVGQLWR
jgi:hypothetical protein